MTTIAGFYVAGARPDSNTGTAGFGVAEVPPDIDYSNTERYVTYNHGRIGNFIEQTSLGFVSNPASGNPRNRGAMSQNGSDFLSDNGWNYVDILRYYYGADIRLVMATTPSSGVLAQTKILSDFELDHGYFNRSPQYTAGNNQNIKYTPNTSINRNNALSHTGTYSQRLSIEVDNEGLPFTMNHIAGIGTTGFGTAVANMSMELRGTLGMWILSTNPGLEISLTLDTTSGTYAGREIEIIHDGLWHRYQWQLDDPMWWSTLQGDNIMSGLASLDTLVIKGIGHATLYMDDLFYNPAGMVPEPASLIMFGLILAGINTTHRQKRVWPF
ncbi:MAG: PEP-CTERM sorting domain-containing protein [Phycisphaerales bacterium]|nr:PEP-CTERM sorting domain-containing protein [Phycisphaerales bacterium]